MSVEQSGHQSWLHEPGTTDSLDESQFDAFGERTLITPPVEPAVAAPDYEVSGRHHTPSWAREPHTEVEAFTAPIHTLEPAFGEPLYAQLFAEENPDVTATQATRPFHKPSATGIQVMSLHDRGPLVKDGEPGSIFEAMMREYKSAKKIDYAELRRPAPSFEQIIASAQPAQTSERPKVTTAAPVAEAPRTAIAIAPVKAIESEATHSIITVKGEQEGSVAAIIEEEQPGLGKQEAATLLTRVLRGLEKSRDADLAAEAAEAARIARAEAEAQAYAEQDARIAQARAEAERLAAEAELARDIAIIDAAAPKEPVEIEAKGETAQLIEQAPIAVREEHLTLSGIRAAAKEAIANHKKAARIAEYAGVAVVAVAAGARLLGRFRRR